MSRRSPRSTVGGGGGGGGGLGATRPPLAALNFAKLRSAIADGASAPAASAAADDAAVVLQALRWRLTKTARRQRRSALQQYMRNSLLDAPTLSALLDANAPPPLREQALRLVNLFASEAAGRTYLLAQPDLVPNLCALLSVEAADTIGRQNTLGALQKLSLRRAPQNSMIDCGVIAWLVEVLADTDSLSQYSVEFGTALLMNLSLRTAGKAKCAADDSQILDVLSQLMENDSLQVRTYVNGTLYSILVKAALKEKALEIGLPDSLRALIEHSDETFARQINYILEQLEKPPVADDDGAASDGEDADDDEEEPDEDDDGEDEEEVDVFAEVALPLDSTDGLSGEGQLAANYLAAVQEAQRDASAAAADDAARREQAAQQAARRRQQEEAEAAAEAEAGGDPKPRHRIHDPDEPLQRPSTPSQTAMKAATNASRASLVDPPPLGEDGIPEPVSYPDPGQIPDDQYEAVFQMRARMPRTPQSGVRPDLPEIKPALTRSDRRASSQDAKGGKPTARPSQRQPPRRRRAGAATPRATATSSSTVRASGECEISKIVHAHAAHTPTAALAFGRNARAAAAARLARASASGGTTVGAAGGVWSMPEPYCHPSTVRSRAKRWGGGSAGATACVSARDGSEPTAAPTVIAAKWKNQSASGRGPRRIRISMATSGLVSISPPIVATRPSTRNVSCRKGSITASPRSSITSNVATSTFEMKSSDHAPATGGGRIDAWKSHAARRLAWYGLISPSCSLVNASAASADSTAAVRRLMWRVIAPKPPKLSGDWRPPASPICITRSKVTGSGESLYETKRPKSTRRSSSSSRSTPW